jgi:hypothetical protein
VIHSVAAVVEPQSIVFDNRVESLQ